LCRLICEAWNAQPNVEVKMDLQVHNIYNMI
jgi:hypothetical protein